MDSSLRRWVSVVRFVVVLCVWACVLSGSAVYAASSSTGSDPGSPGTMAPPSRPTEMVVIPGPLRSFLRMAGISQQISIEDVLPLLARNSYLIGYDESTQTEFLRLLNRYMHQARELEILAAPSGTIHIAKCEDAATLLRVLGYRLREGCGQPGLSLETTNATRAFLTIDSGFPLTELEEALQKGIAFDYAYPTTSVPVLFHGSDWLALSGDRRGSYGSVADVLTNDPLAARLYWALSKEDSETSAVLQTSLGLRKLLPFSATLDFYGSQICIRNGHVTVPGGAKAEPGWKELVGSSPDSPPEFVSHLLAKDNGWLAAYFDAVTRAGQTQQDYLTQSPRLKTLYEGFRSPGVEGPAAIGVFPKASDLVVMFTRLEPDAAGDVYVPGGLEVWKQILKQKADSRTTRDLAKRARTWTQPEQLIEGMAADSRVETDAGPLQIYLMLSELDRARPAQNRLSADTVKLLANRFTALSSWYLIFTEFPSLSEQSIVRFVTVADTIDKMPDAALRGNAMGDFQASVGLWQILARQGEIATSQLDSSWSSMIEPFAKVTSSTQLFDAARASLGVLTSVATGKTGISQDELVELLAGPQQESADGQQVHAELAKKIRLVLFDQRLVSLDTLFALSDGLNDMAQGHPATEHLLSLAEELRDFELPRQIFSKSEKVSWAPRDNTGHHAELQAKIDLTKVIETPSTRIQLEAARGKLSPLLRDALVGLNYAYYEPPSAQILHINPLFVRSHDFLGISVTGAERLWQTPMLMGTGVSAGGGAYLMGSLADLPYSLATAEQDLIAPENVQALIWKELVPELLADAVLARWWNVTPNELHAVALYQQFGEELMSASAKSPELRAKVVGILSDRMDERHLRSVDGALQRPEDTATLLPRMMPANIFYLGTEFQKRFPADAASLGQTGGQLKDLAERHASEVSWERLSRDFGVPHPTLARTYARELLNVKPFPFYGAYSSRLFGERWESGNLYWARLADQMGYSPVMLNRLVPELTRHMVAKIFATDLEDWPAVLRAMQETGSDFKQGKIVLLPTANATAATLAPAGSAGSSQ
jgi:hypothetical protein